MLVNLQRLDTHGKPHPWLFVGNRITRYLTCCMVMSLAAAAQESHDFNRGRCQRKATTHGETPSTAVRLRWGGSRDEVNIMASHTYQDPIGFYEWFDDLPYAIQDSILKHLPHIEGEEWFIVIIFASLILMILVSAYLGFARHNVKKTSERLNALKELNNTTEFMPVEAQYRYYLRSDTKLEYEEFSLPKFFRREVRENFKLFNTLLGNARANTVLYETYALEIQELPDWTESDDDCGRHIPFFLYHNIEKELYDETVLDCPVTSPEFVCTKSYLPKDSKEPIETEETYTLEELEEYIRRLKVAADVKKNGQNAG